MKEEFIKFLKKVKAYNNYMECLTKQGEEFNNFIKENDVYIPSDDEGNLYQRACEISLKPKYVSTTDSTRSSIEDVYDEDDVIEYTTDPELILEKWDMKVLP